VAETAFILNTDEAAIAVANITNLELDIKILTFKTL
jgi:hypothetical protein